MRISMHSQNRSGEQVGYFALRVPWPGFWCRLAQSGGKFEF